MLEKTLESPKEVQPVHPKGDQSWVFIGRTDVEAKTPILWPSDGKSWLIWKDPDAGKDWGQEEKGTTEDEMVGWHHRLDGHEFGWALGVGDGQGGLACYSPWGCKESDMTERLNETELNSLLLRSPLWWSWYSLPQLLVFVQQCPIQRKLPHPDRQTFPGDSSYVRTSPFEGLKEAASLKGHSRAKLLVESTQFAVVIALHFNLPHPLILLFPLHPRFCSWAPSLILFCMQTSVSMSISKETNRDTPQWRV